jgi:hypothetical protein
MSLIISQFSNWDDTKIEMFIEFKKLIQSKLPTYFPESLEDYKKFLHPDSPFSKDYQWSGFLVHRNKKVVGKAILSWRNGAKVGNLGFIDWENDPAVAKLLTEKIEAYAKSMNLNEIKTPVDINFFVKYRIKCKGGGNPYYGEPIYPDYYHDLFKATGYSVIGTWDTYLVKRYSTFTNYMKKRKKLKERKHAHDDKVTVRFIKISDWDNELKIVYKLFQESFSSMPEFEPISFDQFKLVYDDFKYLIHPLLSYIVELKGEPVGFSINYPDPLAILSKVKDKKLSKLDKIMLLAKLRLNFKTLLMPYMGKTRGPNGEEVKGVFIKVSKMLAYGVLAANKGLICYQSPDSPSKRPIDPDLVQEYAKYVLYGKILE